MNKLKNAVPKSYRAFYITPGIADYTAEGIGAVLVGKEALDKIASTYVGKPVVNLEHTDKEPEELFELSKNSKPEDFADGIIAATGFDEKSGWHYMDFLVWDDDTQENLENGYSVSCAYDVTEVDEAGGTYNNVPYAEEVLDGEGLHLAIVPNPRYERAYVIQNSKSEEETLKVKFFKKKEAPVKKKKVQNMEPDEKKDDEETMENMDGYVENEKGEQIPISELANMYMEKKNAGKAYNMDDEVEIDGERMTVKELMSACGYGEEMENAEPAQTDDAEEVVDETKQMNNQKPDPKKVKNENFTKVKNAAGKDSGDNEKPPNLNTQSERFERGKSRYGTPVAQGGK
ncbi:MAG: DUF2213 domain-containing protein [Gammaproteobacteria bacterium]|nr:DUF2213 domain-containing protein [Gammaproteobacteria bacterium]